jgi:hypothetical protein
MKKIKPVVTKKYVFARRLDGKPIVLDFFDNDMRKENFEATRQLLFDLRVHEWLHDDPAYAWISNHEIHCILPRDYKPYTMVIKAGTKFETKD